jgi:hypothetical protein
MSVMAIGGEHLDYLWGLVIFVPPGILGGDGIIFNHPVALCCPDRGGAAVGEGENLYRQQATGIFDEHDIPAGDFPAGFGADAVYFHQPLIAIFLGFGSAFD